MFFPMLLNRPYSGKTGTDQFFSKKALVGVKQGTLKRLQATFQNFQKNLERIETREEFFKKNPRLLTGPLNIETLYRMLPFSRLSQKVSGLPIPCYPSHIVTYYNHLQESDKLSVLSGSDDEIIQVIQEIVGAYIPTDRLLKSHVIPYLRALSGGDLNALERKILKVSGEYFQSCFLDVQSDAQKEKNEFLHADHL